MTAETRTDRKRWMALYVLCAGMLMIVLDATIVNVALPSIQDDLGFSQSNLAWVVNAYLIAFGGLLLLAGRIGDLIGQRRIFLLGLAVFTGASVLCAVAQSQGLLIGARFVQGIGGALTSAVILGMIVTMFPDPREQAKAIGVYTFVAVAGGSIGLLAGGALTEAINWHWIFFVNAPVGVATALFALRLVEGGEGIGLAGGADIPGAVLLTGGLMVGVYTILQVGEQGWGSPRTLVLGGASIALLAAFVARQWVQRSAPVLVVGRGDGGSARRSSRRRPASASAAMRRCAPTSSRTRRPPRWPSALAMRLRRSWRWSATSRPRRASLPRSPPGAAGRAGQAGGSRGGTAAAWGRALGDRDRPGVGGHRHAAEPHRGVGAPGGGGPITINPDHITCRLKSRTYSPVMRSADLPNTEIPWWNGRHLRLQFA